MVCLHTHPSGKTKQKEQKQEYIEKDTSPAAPGESGWGDAGVDNPTAYITHDCRVGIQQDAFVGGRLYVSASVHVVHWVRLIKCRKKAISTAEKQLRES
jgi:hypothetical protein